MTEENTVEGAGSQGVSRRTIMKGAAWTVPALMVATSAPAFAASAEGCPDGSLWNAQARGRLLSGGLGALNLDVIAEAKGVHAAAWDPTKNPFTPYPGEPGPATGGIGYDKQAGPLNVTALNFLSVALGLQVNVGAPTGVINQYAFAKRNGYAIGASGAVADGGAVALDAGGANAPQLATLDLKTVLSHLTAPVGPVGTALTALVGNVSNLTLNVGALWGKAETTACTLAAVRAYAIAYLRLALKSNLVGALLAPIQNLGSISINTGIVNALGPILNNPLISITSNVTATVNVGGLTGPLPNDPTAALSMNLGTGDATLDVGTLIGGLSNKTPNTRLFVDANAVSSQGASVLLTSWIQSLLDNVITLGGTIQIKAAGLINITLTVSGTLSHPTVVVSAGNLGLGLITPLLSSIATAVAQSVMTTLTTTGPLKTALDNLQNLVLAPLFTVLQSVLLIALNLQNGQPSTWTLPGDFTSLPGPSGTTTGQYDVAALHVGIVSGIVTDTAYPVVNLHVGRGSVGQIYKR